MAKAIFKVFFGLIMTVTNIVLAPINLLINGLFPDLSQLIYKFNVALNTYLGGSLAWFFNIIPSSVRSLIIIYLTILISYYTISISVHAILKVYRIIKNIKFW